MIDGYGWYRMHEEALERQERIDARSEYEDAMADVMYEMERDMVLIDESIRTDK